VRTPKELFRSAFSPTLRRDKRSRTYRIGVLDALKLRAGEITGLPGRYLPGSVEFDAWRAGVDEGHQIWSSSGDVKHG